MAEMAWAFEGRLLVVAHTKVDPVVDWDAFVEQLAAHAKQHWATDAPRVLVFTEGGGPNAVQRKALLDKVPQIRNARGAVLTSNAIVRGVATAFSWFTAGFRVFHPSELEAGLAWLELREGDRSAIGAGMARVRRELGDRVHSLPCAM